MTFQPRTPWVSINELLSLALSDRIKYVRGNLPAGNLNGKSIGMTLDEFAEAVGAPNRQAPIRWEKGGTPRDYAKQIAALTPYPPAAFGADGEAELVRETLGSRLRALEETAVRVEDLGRVETVLREAIVLLANGDAQAALRALQERT